MSIMVVLPLTAPAAMPAPAHAPHATAVAGRAAYASPAAASNALAIARRIGLDPEVLEAAERAERLAPGRRFDIVHCRGYSSALVARG